MVKYLTVKELIRELRRYDENAIAVIYREGKGHSSPITRRDVQDVESPYFPDGDVKFPDEQKYVQVGVI